MSKKWLSRSKQVRPWEHQLWTLPGEQLHHEQVVKDNQEYKYPVKFDLKQPNWLISSVIRITSTPKRVSPGTYVCSSNFEIWIHKYWMSCLQTNMDYWERDRDIENNLSFRSKVCFVKKKIWQLPDICLIREHLYIRAWVRNLKLRVPLVR